MDHRPGRNGSEAFWRHGSLEAAWPWQLALAAVGLLIAWCPMSWHQRPTNEFGIRWALGATAHARSMRIVFCVERFGVSVGSGFAAGQGRYPPYDETVFFLKLGRRKTRRECPIILVFWGALLLSWWPWCLCRDRPVHGVPAWILMVAFFTERRELTLTGNL